MILTHLRLATLVGLTGLASATARAHDGLHEKIVKATQQITAEPRRADLHLLRSDLYRRHQDWELAFADLKRATVLDPNIAGAEFTRGQLLRDMGWLTSAAEFMDLHLEGHPEDLIALRVRAELATQRLRPEGAVGFYDRLIRGSSPATPDDYIARARAQLAMGAGREKIALGGVEQGIEKLGDAVSLVFFAVDLDRQVGEWDRALGRIDRLASYASRKESFQALRGDVLLQAGRRAAAQAAYRSCLESIRALRARRRQAPAMQELEARMRLALDDLLTKRRPESKR